MPRHNRNGRVRGFRRPNVGRYSQDMLSAPQRRDIARRLRSERFLVRLEAMGFERDDRAELLRRAENLAMSGTLSFNAACDVIADQAAAGSIRPA